jgi:hypothetical protein
MSRRMAGRENYQQRWMMKRPGRFLGNLLAMVLTVVSVQAVAETQLGGRDFNHMTTGFPLSGGHATAACETCHEGGVFKGTPRNCDGCHALGKRIVATPKSNSHIVTDAPCESCHFNTSTFLGARFNHATARPGDCASCHNGRQATAKPASHSSGKKATDSCDHCHRTSAFIPASWNHIGVAPGTCTNCHVPGGQSSISKPASHTSGSIKGMNQCDDCHSFTGWFPARFKHNTGAACSSCHNGILATGKISGHLATTDECSQCHFSTITWSPALGAKPANHIPYNAGVNCSNCHTGLAKVGVATLHANSVATHTCAECHITPNSYTGNNQNTRKSHDGSSGNNCTGCHEHSNSGSYGGW